ncbi:hypothetical protein DFH09DRAFT_1304425 [Mycena vulgaris]|nr:hypothetical protein DFH09DRAFT_1304425 [Mycena vulgaris]
MDMEMERVDVSVPPSPVTIDAMDSTDAMNAMNATTNTHTNTNMDTIPLASPLPTIDAMNPPARALPVTLVPAHAPPPPFPPLSPLPPSRSRSPPAAHTHPHSPHATSRPSPVHTPPRRPATCLARRHSCRRAGSVTPTPPLAAAPPLVDVELVDLDVDAGLDADVDADADAPFPPRAQVEVRGRGGGEKVEAQEEEDVEAQEGEEGAEAQEEEEEALPSACAIDAVVGGCTAVLERRLMITRVTASGRRKRHRGTPSPPPCLRSTRARTERARAWNTHAHGEHENESEEEEREDVDALPSARAIDVVVGRIHGGAGAPAYAYADEDRAPPFEDRVSSYACGDAELAQAEEEQETEEEGVDENEGSSPYDYDAAPWGGADAGLVSAYDVGAQPDTQEQDAPSVLFAALESASARRLIPREGGEADGEEEGDGDENSYSDYAGLVDEERLLGLASASPPSALFSKPEFTPQAASARRATLPIASTGKEEKGCNAAIDVGARAAGASFIL